MVVTCLKIRENMFGTHKIDRTLLPPGPEVTRPGFYVHGMAWLRQDKANAEVPSL